MYVENYNFLATKILNILEKVELRIHTVKSETHSFFSEIWWTDYIIIGVKLCCYSRNRKLSLSMPPKHHSFIVKEAVTSQWENCLPHWILLSSTCMISIFVEIFSYKCASSALSICQTQICQEKKKEKKCKRVEDRQHFVQKKTQALKDTIPLLGIYIFKTFEGLFLWAVEGESERCQLISVSYFFYIYFYLYFGGRLLVKDQPYCYLYSPKLSAICTDVISCKFCENNQTHWRHVSDLAAHT